MANPIIIFFPKVNFSQCKIEGTVVASTVIVLFSHSRRCELCDTRLFSCSILLCGVLSLSMLRMWNVCLNSYK
jgi:hypothetical protein